MSGNSSVIGSSACALVGGSAFALGATPSMAAAAVLGAISGTAYIAAKVVGSGICQAAKALQRSNVVVPTPTDIVDDWEVVPTPVIAATATPTVDADDWVVVEPVQ